MIRDPLVADQTASGTQTQAAGTVVSADTVFATISVAGDAFTLDAGYARGARVLIRNLGANAGVVFPPLGGTINGAGANASAALAASKATELICKSTDGLTWFFSGLSA